MISLEDCIAMSGLSEAEILALAEHEHIPESVACALANYLSVTEEGLDRVRDMIVEDIRHAQLHGSRQHVLELLHVLHHFLRDHPAARPPVHPWSRYY